MEAVVDRLEQTDRVGTFAFRVVIGESASGLDEVAEQRARRTEALTRWLLAQWQREQQRRIAERN